jgi:hypothetical protein
MKVFYYLVFVLIIGSCSVESEETSTATDYGTSDGSASSPVDLTVGTAKEGSFAKYGSSYYKFTPSSTGAGSYKLAIGSLSVSDSWSSSSSVTTSLYSDSGYSTSNLLASESCLASCTLNFNYQGLDNSSTYYLKIYGYGKGTYSLTVSQGGSEGSVNNPVVLTLGSTAHSGKVEGTSSYGKSYYKFTTADSGDARSHTLTMTNSDSMDCDLYSDSGFSTLASSTHSVCEAGDNLTATFAIDGSNPLPASTTYYLRIEGESTTAKASTYNITVASGSGG